MRDAGPGIGVRCGAAVSSRRGSSVPVGSSRPPTDAPSAALRGAWCVDQACICAAMSPFIPLARPKGVGKKTGRNASRLTIPPASHVSALGMSPPTMASETARGHESAARRAGDSAAAIPPGALSTPAVGRGVRRDEGAGLWSRGQRARSNTQPSDAGQRGASQSQIANPSLRLRRAPC